jgi:hypothetical protein
MWRSGVLATSLGLVTTLGATAPAGAQADAECVKTLAEYDATRTSMNEHLSDHELRGFAVLRNAVQFLAQNEREDACEELVETYGRMLAERRESLVEEGLMVEADEQERAERLRAAPKVSDLKRPLRAGEIIGGDLVNLMNENLGDIEDVVIDPESGSISHVLVETGGFLGLGEDVVAVPLQALAVTDNINTFILDMTAERFAEAPEVEADAIDKVKDAKWQEQNDAYYLAANQ